MDTTDKGVILNIYISPEIRTQMKAQASLKGKSIPKIWEQAGIFFLKSLGVSVNLDTDNTPGKEIAENTMQQTG